MKNWSWYIAHLANFLSMSCHMSSTLLSVHWKQTGFEDWQIGWLAASFSAAAIVSRFGLGRGMERFGRRPFLFLGAALLQLTPAVYPYLGDQFFLWVATRMVQGFGLGIYITAILTWVADVSPPDKIGQMQGVFGISGLLGGAAGPFIFEKLYLNYGFPEMFHWLLLAGIACWVLASTLPETRSLDPIPTKAGAGEKFNPMEHVPTIVVSIPFGWVVGTIISFIAPFFETLHMAKVGVYFAGFAVASVAVRVFAGSLIDLVSINTLVWGSGGALVGSGITIALLSKYPNTWLLLAAAVLNGIGHGFLFPSLSAHIVKNSEPQHRGTGLALFTGVFDVGILIGGLCSGYISQAEGYPAAFLVSGLLMFLSLPAFVILNRRKLPSS